MLVLEEVKLALDQVNPMMDQNVLLDAAIGLVVSACLLRLASLLMKEKLVLLRPNKKLIGVTRVLLVVLELLPLREEEWVLLLVLMAWAKILVVGMKVVKVSEARRYRISCQGYINQRK